MAESSATSSKKKAPAKRPNLRVVTAPIPVATPAPSDENKDKKKGIWETIKAHPYMDAGGAAVVVILGYAIHKYEKDKSASSTAATTAASGSSTAGNNWSGDSGEGGGYGGGFSGGGSSGGGGSGGGGWTPPTPNTPASSTTTNNYYTTPPTSNPLPPTPVTPTVTPSVTPAQTTAKGSPIAASVTKGQTANPITAPQRRANEPAPGGTVSADIGQLAAAIGLEAAPNPASLQGVPKSSIWAYDPATGSFKATSNFNPAAGSTLYAEKSYVTAKGLKGFS